MTILFTERLKRLWSLARPRIDGTDLSHDADHVLRVSSWAVRLARDEGVDSELACAAGIAHDLVNVPKESPDRPQASALSAIAGTELLRQAGFDDEAVMAVVNAVRTCSWSRGLAPTSPLGAVLQDADRLDAMGAIGIARVIACAQGMATRGTGARLYDPDDPDATGQRTLNDHKFVVDHFRAKLLKLAESMHTATGQRHGRLRHAFMEQYLAQLRSEADLSPINDVAIR